MPWRVLGEDEEALIKPQRSAEFVRTAVATSNVMVEGNRSSKVRDVLALICTAIGLRDSSSLTLEQQVMAADKARVHQASLGFV